MAMPEKKIRPFLGRTIEGLYGQFEIEHSGGIGFYGALASWVSRATSGARSSLICELAMDTASDGGATSLRVAFGATGELTDETTSVPAMHGIDG